MWDGRFARVWNRSPWTVDFRCPAMVYRSDAHPAHTLRSPKRTNIVERLQCVNLLQGSGRVDCQNGLDGGDGERGVNQYE